LKERKREVGRERERGMKRGREGGETLISRHLSASK